MPPGPQLAFAWSSSASYDDADFIVSPSNEAACSLLAGWPEAPAWQGKRALLLTGPASSGKTHLAERWRKRRRATRIDPAHLGRHPSAIFWENADSAVLENIDQIHDDTALFHLLRHTETHHAALLLTSRLLAPRLPFTLPDCVSRLTALPTTHLAPPDDALLHGFFAKCMADRQLRIADNVITYCVHHAERTLASTLRLVDAMERYVFTHQKPITLPTAKALLQDAAPFL